MLRKRQEVLRKEETGSAEEGRDRKCQGWKIQEMLKKEETESAEEGRDRKY